jgi:hypothetical protein
MRTRIASAAAPLLVAALASCTRFGPLPETPAPDAGTVHAPTDAGVPVVLPDSDPEVLRAAQEAVKAKHLGAPIRLELIADLLSSTLLGFAPGDAADGLETRLGKADVKGAVWRWPSLGIEAAVEGGKIARVALHASLRAADPEMKIFVGEVLVGTKPLTGAAPLLEIQQVVNAIGPAGARGQSDAEVTELAWRRGAQTLYLTFDAHRLELEAIVLEPFDEKLWSGMKPLEQSKNLWDIAPGSVPAARDSTIAFAQLGGPMTAAEANKLRLVGKQLTNAGLLFTTLQKRFLGPQDAFVLIDGKRAALLRADGCTYLVRETDDDQWEARNPNIACDPEREPEGLIRLKRIFATPKK